jgi:hypothetical protein
VATAALIALPTASGRTAGQNLHAYVPRQEPGPVPACSDTSGTDCPPASSYRFVVHVANTNRLADFDTHPKTRTTVPNAFVVTGIDQSINGVPFDNTQTPPDAFYRLASGR